MSSGESFTEAQTQEITRALHSAGDETGLHFSVFVGDPEGDVKQYAQRVHAGLGSRATKSVLILVAPGPRRVEIVTGSVVTDRLDDRSCALAGLSMSTAFAGGDLAGGIVTGVRMLAESAGPGQGDGSADRPHLPSTAV